MKCIQYDMRMRHPRFGPLDIRPGKVYIEEDRMPG